MIVVEIDHALGGVVEAGWSIVGKAAQSLDAALESVAPVSPQLCALHDAGESASDIARTSRATAYRLLTEMA